MDIGEIERVGDRPVPITIPRYEPERRDTPSAPTPPAPVPAEPPPAEKVPA